MIHRDKPHNTRDNRMNTPTFKIISYTQTSALPITKKPAHEYHAQIVGSVFKVVLSVKNEHKRII
jgi:hypothetical protein